jgi:hypothetical protein
MPLLEDLYARQRAREIELSPFHYSANFLGGVVIANVTLAPVNTGIQSDSHFVVRYIQMTARTGGAGSEVVAVATPPFDVSFFDTGSGRTLFDSPQPVQNVCGGVAAGVGMGNLPFILPEPWLIRAGGTVQTTLTNAGATAFQTVKFSFVGFKVFKFGGGGPADI